MTRIIIVILTFIILSMYWHYDSLTQNIEILRHEKSILKQRNWQLISRVDSLKKEMKWLRGRR